MKTTCILKRRHFIVMAMCFFAYTANAQLKVASNGYSAFANTSSPLSPISVGYAGLSDYMIASCGSKNGIFSQTTSTQTGFRYAGFFFATVNGVSGFNIGLRSEAFSTSTVYNAGRSYGIYGLAGNATNGYNYGLFGSLKGSHNGAAVYGTIYGDDGTDTGGYYAGYFYGNTKVSGTLYVTGGISGTLLSKGFSSDNIDMQAQTVYSARGEESAALVSRLSELELVSFSQESEQDAVSVQSIDADTIATPRVVSAMEKQASEKQHYALSVEQLEASFPELVYEQEDGSKAVNYVELVPVLVQCINELSARVSELEGNSVKRVSSDRTSESVDAQQTQIIYPITVDGKVIGNKRINMTK